MSTASIAAVAAAAVLAVLAPPARADLEGAVNRARMQGCAPAGESPLRNSGKLGQAARRMAEGTPLNQALSAAGYPAAQVSAVHLNGAVTDFDVARVLAANYCRTLTDRHLSEVGMLRKGGDVWIVLASPAAIPQLADANAISRRILDIVNRARLAGRRCGSKVYPPVAALTQNPLLTKAALAHSQDMAAHGVFDHRGHDGSSPAMRVERAGYRRYLAVGENIAAGAMTPTEAAQGWLDSPPHCENIMDARFSEIGIAFAVNLSRSELVYWTQVFAAP